MLTRIFLNDKVTNCKEVSSGGRNAEVKVKSTVQYYLKETLNLMKTESNQIKEKNELFLNRTNFGT